MKYNRTLTALTATIRAAAGPDTVAIVVAIRCGWPMRHGHGAVQPAPWRVQRRAYPGWQAGPHTRLPGAAGLPREDLR
jgi:hypothetical protein